MSFLQRLLNRGKTTPLDPQRSVATYLPQRYIPSDLRLSEEEALSVSAVFGCVRVISEALASSPWNVYEVSDGLRSEVEDDIVGYLLNVRPNPEVTAIAFKEALVVQAIAFGNAFAEIVRDRAGRISELWLLPSQRVMVLRDKNGTLYYEYQNPQGGPQVVLMPNQVLHFRALATLDGLMGDSVLGRAAKTIANAFAAERYSLNYFGSNAQVGGVLKVPRALTPEEEKALQESWDAGRAGVRNAFRTAVLPPGVEWTATAGDPEKSALVENRKMSVAEIIRYFGVPGHLVGDPASSQGYGKNLSELGIAFVRNTLRPWKMRMEQEFTYKLFPQRAPWRWAEMDTTWMTLGNALEVAQTQDIYLKNGVFSVNEVREQLGENPVEDGDERVNLAEQSEPQTSQTQAEEADTEDGMDGGQEDAGDTEDTLMGVAAVHRMALSKHKARLVARKADLEKTLKNGVLQEKLLAAVEQSRHLAERDLNHAGLNPPPNWMSALMAVEQGGDPVELAKALNEVRS